MNQLPNFQRILQDLMTLGWTQQKIADEIEVAQPTISRLLAGKRVDPPASVAFPLFELHRKQMALAKRRARRKVA